MEEKSKVETQKSKVGIDYGLWIMSYGLGEFKVENFKVMAPSTRLRRAQPDRKLRMTKGVQSSKFRIQSSKFKVG